MTTAKLQQFLHICKKNIARSCVCQKKCVPLQPELVKSYEKDLD